MTVFEGIVEVLTKFGRSRPKAISEELLRRGSTGLSGTTPDRTVSKELTEDIRRYGDYSTFRRVSRGEYELRNSSETRPRSKLNEIDRYLMSCPSLSNVIILTYRINFSFFEGTVLPSIQSRSPRTRSPRITIFADAQTCTDSYEKDRKSIRELGRTYRVVPIVTYRPSSFHPKAVFLASESCSTLFIGSGNVDSKSWNRNYEMWVKYSTNQNKPDVFFRFETYVKSIIKTLEYRPQELEDEIRAAFSYSQSFQPPDIRPAHSLPPPLPLLGCPMSRAPLLDRIRILVDYFRSGNRIDQIYICSPFFDKDLTALLSIVDRLQPHTGQVLTGNSPLRLWESAKHNIQRLNRSMKFQKVTRHDYEFLHMKFYAVRCKEEVMVISGSANCTATGLLLQCGRANSELMVWRTMSADRFETEVLNELEFEQLHFEFEDPNLGHDTDHDRSGIAPQPQHKVRIVSASKFKNSIHVHYQLSASGNDHRMRVRALRADSDPTQVLVRHETETVVVAEVQKTPRDIVLIASDCSSMGEGHGTNESLSFPHWVDDEDHLEQTAPIRPSRDSISDDSGDETVATETNNSLSEDLRHQAEHSLGSDATAGEHRGHSHSIEDDPVEEWITEFCHPLNLRKCSVEELVSDIESVLARLCRCLSAKGIESRQFSRSLTQVMSSTLIYSYGDHSVQINRDWNCWWDRISSDAFGDQFRACLVTSRIPECMGLLAVVSSNLGQCPELAAIQLCAVLSLCRVLAGFGTSRNSLVSERISESYSQVFAGSGRGDMDNMNSLLHSAMRTSRTLRSLDHILLRVGLDDLIESVNTEHVSRGDLGWQPALGYCLVKHSHPEKGISCLAPHRGWKVKGDKYEVNIVKSRLVSINALLRVGGLTNFGLSNRKEELLTELLTSLRSHTRFDWRHGQDQGKERIASMLTWILQRQQ